MQNVISLPLSTLSVITAQQTMKSTVLYCEFSSTQDIYRAWIASALNFIRCRKSWNKFRQLVFFMNKFTIPHTLLHQSPDRKRVRLRPKKPILLLLHHSLLSNLCFCVITFWSSTFISDCLLGSLYRTDENTDYLCNMQ